MYLVTAILILAWPELAQDTNSDFHIPWTHHDQLILAHACCGSIAFLLCVPTAVLIGRLGRGIPGWVNVHRGIQVLTLPLAIATIVLGIYATRNSFSGHLNDTHKRNGVAVFVLLNVQIFLGALIHHLYDPNRVRRPIRNWCHVILGITVAILGAIQVRLGMGEYSRLFARETPKAVIVVYWIVIGLTALAYIIGVLGLVTGKGPGSEKQRRKEMSELSLPLTSPNLQEQPGTAGSVNFRPL